MSPTLRRKALDRLVLLGAWTGDRAGLSVDDFARLAGVARKRFYQMAAAWKKAPGLAATGAHAGGPSRGAPRVDERVNGALQAVVAKVVAAAPAGAPPEVMRRSLEAAARLWLDRHVPDGSSLALPSRAFTRDVLLRELHRVAESAQLGDSVAGDCCATNMLHPDGAPRVLFCLIDRGTRRILGGSFGMLEEDVAAYGRAAADALARIDDLAAGAPVWAETTRQLNLVAGVDGAGWRDLRREMAAVGGMPDFQPIVREGRHGSQYRRYVGDRVGRVLMRFGSTLEASAATRGEVYEDVEAASRLATEIAAYNRHLPPLPAGGREDAPRDLVGAFRLLALEAEVSSPP